MVGSKGVLTLKAARRQKCGRKMEGNENSEGWTVFYTLRKRRAGHGTRFTRTGRANEFRRARARKLSVSRKPRESLRLFLSRPSL